MTWQHFFNNNMAWQHLHHIPGLLSTNQIFCPSQMSMTTLRSYTSTAINQISLPITGTDKHEKTSIIYTGTAINQSYLNTYHRWAWRHCDYILYTGTAINQSNLLPITGEIEHTEILYSYQTIISQSIPITGEIDHAEILYSYQSIISQYLSQVSVTPLRSWPSAAVYWWSRGTTSSRPRL
jgi:hypothetical protein